MQIKLSTFRRILKEEVQIAILQESLSNKGSSDNPYVSGEYPSANELSRPDTIVWNTHGGNQFSIEHNGADIYASPGAQGKDSVLYQNVPFDEDRMHDDSTYFDSIVDAYIAMHGITRIYDTDSGEFHPANRNDTGTLQRLNMKVKIGARALKRIIKEERARLVQPVNESTLTRAGLRKLIKEAMQGSAYTFNGENVIDPAGNALDFIDGLAWPDDLGAHDFRSEGTKQIWLNAWANFEFPHGQWSAGDEARYGANKQRAIHAILDYYKNGSRVSEAAATRHRRRKLGKKPGLVNEAFDRPHGPGDAINYDQVLIEIYKAKSADKLMVDLQEQGWKGVGQFIDSIQEINEQNSAMICGTLNHPGPGTNVNAFTLDLREGRLYVEYKNGTINENWREIEQYKNDPNTIVIEYGARAALFVTHNGQEIYSTFGHPNTVISHEIDDNDDSFQVYWAINNYVLALPTPAKDMRVLDTEYSNAPIAFYDWQENWQSREETL